MFTTAHLLMIIIGAASIPLGMGAVAWSKSLNLRMNWWKWILAAIWYFLLLFCLYLDFTFMGEGEVSTGWKLLLFQGVILLVLAVGLVRILAIGRKQPNS